MDEPEARISKLEQDVAVIKEHVATKMDIAELKAEISAKLAVVKADVLVRLAEVEGGLRTDFERSSGRLFRWVVVVVLLGQLLPGLLKHVGM